MDFEPKGPEAARLRQRKFALLRQFPFPQICCQARCASAIPGVESLRAIAQRARGTPLGR